MSRSIHEGSVDVMAFLLLYAAFVSSLLAIKNVGAASFAMEATPMAILLGVVLLGLTGGAITGGALIFSRQGKHANIAFTLAAVAAGFGGIIHLFEPTGVVCSAIALPCILLLLSPRGVARWSSRLTRNHQRARLIAGTSFTAALVSLLPVALTGGRATILVVGMSIASIGSGAVLAALQWLAKKKETGKESLDLAMVTLPSTSFKAGIPAAIINVFWPATLVLVFFLATFSGIYSSHGTGMHPSILSAAVILACSGGGVGALLVLVLLPGRERTRAAIFIGATILLFMLALFTTVQPGIDDGALYFTVTLLATALVPLTAQGTTSLHVLVSKNKIASALDTVLSTCSALLASIIVVVFYAVRMVGVDIIGYIVLLGLIIATVAQVLVLVASPWRHGAAGGAEIKDGGTVE